VAHFAVENPHGDVSLFINLSWDPIYDGDGNAIGGGYEHINETVPVPDIAAVWRLLAGRAGVFLYDGNGRYLTRDPDHYKAALALLPWMSREELGPDYLRGRLGEVLRHERKNVEQLLRENWHVVTRVAEAAMAQDTLDDAQLRGLIEGHGDLVKVYESSVWDAYAESGEKYSALWQERDRNLNRAGTAANLGEAAGQPSPEHQGLAPEDRP
jgi:hypothetical protein